jgi:predicted transcriptional regulator
MARTNLTLQLDEDLVREIKVLAAKKGTSASGLMARFARKVIAADVRYQKAMRAAFESMNEAATSGRAVPRWTREEINDRW